MREGQVWYSRYYGYNLDGSRRVVERDDMLNSAHRDVYAYDPVSGRLSSVTDTVPEPDVVHSFAWNPEGTLARWENNAPNSYARVFGYDEEGRLVKIERDYGSGGVQVAYEYGYNSDDAKMFERKYFTIQRWRDYRSVGCGTGCTGSSLSLYAREHTEGQNLAWTRAEEYVSTPTGSVYRVPQSTGEPPVSFALSPTTNVYVVHYPDGQMVAPHYTDSGGTQVGGFTLPVCAEKRDWEAGCVPNGTCDNATLAAPYGAEPKPSVNGSGGIPQFGLTTDQYYDQVVILPQAAFLPIFLGLLAKCLIGIASDLVARILFWIGCVIGTKYRGGCAECTCGSFPVPGLCDILGGCIAGILGGSIGKMIGRFFPRLSESLRDILDDLMAVGGGAFSGGICFGLSKPLNPCPHPRPSPSPTPPTPVPSLPSGGTYRPLPAY